MRRRGLLAGAWVVATLVATLVAWGAVQQVTAEVSPTTVLPLPEVAVAAVGASEPPSRDVAQTTDRPRTRPQRSPRRGANPTEPAPAQTPPGQPAEDPQPRSPAPNPEPEGDGTVTEAYRLQGGLVTVRYRGAAATLAGATPNSGFVVEVNASGPQKVDVRFRSDEHESRFVTRVRDGEPDPQREERAR